jgi:hypothetical protein
MRQILYAMQFTGQAAPVSGAANILKASTTSPSCSIATVVGADGVHGTLERTGGGTAAFESQVTFTGEGVFQESGSITFGDGGHRLHFSTVGQGYLGPSVEPGLQHGAVSWRIDRGEGQLAGASGLITSNFFVSATGEVTDNHFGVIFVP